MAPQMPPAVRQIQWLRHGSQNRDAPCLTSLFFRCNVLCRTVTGLRSYVFSLRPKLLPQGKREAGTGPLDRRLNACHGDSSDGRSLSVTPLTAENKKPAQISLSGLL